MSSLLWRDICPVIVDIYIYMSGYSGDIYICPVIVEIYICPVIVDIYICPVIVEIYMSGFRGYICVRL